MIHDLPEEVRIGLEKARQRDFGRRNRLRVHVDDAVFPILRLTGGGFVLDAKAAPLIRGLVDIYDSGRHLYQCLVVCSSVEGDERVYEFKRQTAVVDQPPLDYWRGDDTPVALLN
ncbi:MAG: hypothetical protein KDK00_11980 [Rhodobacteraceae bacterium]|nr:hypothetical protein [Paracoccaceae bacterium]